MSDAMETTFAAGKAELAAILLFGFGWLLAVLAIPAVVWFQMLHIAPQWMTSALLWSASIPVTAGLIYAVADGTRRVRRQESAHQGFGTGTR